MGLFSKRKQELKKKEIATDRELTEDELDEVTAGIPVINNDDKRSI